MRLVLEVVPFFLKTIIIIIIIIAIITIIIIIAMRFLCIILVLYQRLLLDKVYACIPSGVSTVDIIQFL